MSRKGLEFLLTIIIVGIISKLLWNKTRRKALRLKEEINQKEEEGWSSPIFNNVGFAIGIFLISFIVLVGIVALISIVRKEPIGLSSNELILYSINLLMALGFLFGTPFIKIFKDRIFIQPLLFKLLGLNLFSKNILFTEIKNISLVKTNMRGFFGLVIYTKSFKKIRLNTAFFNSEVALAIYKVIKEKISKIAKPHSTI